MIKFLKSLFGRDESPEPVEETVKLSEAKEWLSQAVAEDKSSIQQGLSLQSTEIAKIMSDIKSALDVLQRSELKNANIAQRAKDIMEGNRNTYVKRTLAFLDTIKPVSQPSDVDGFVEQFKDRLLELNTASSKSYYVLQEFFAHESKDVAILIRKLDEAVEGLKKGVDESKHGSITRAERLLEDYAKKEVAKRHMLEAIAQLEHESAALLKQKLDTEKDVEDTKKSEAYARYFEIIQKKEDEAKRVAAIEQEASSLFAALEPALHKLVRISPQDPVAEDYIKNIKQPLEALHRDANLHLIQVCSQMSKLIETAQIELKDKRKERALDALQRIKESYLRDIIARHDEANQSLHALSQQMLKNAAMQDYNELDYRLSHINSKLGNIQGQIDDLKRSSEKIDLDSIRLLLQSELRSCTERNITLV